MSLVLSRRVGESLQVGEATVTIGQISGNRMRLIITAPPHLHIRRSELAPLDHSSPSDSSSPSPPAGAPANGHHPNQRKRATPFQIKPVRGAADGAAGGG